MVVAASWNRTHPEDVAVSGFGAKIIWKIKYV
jgi:hypothetical protein